MTDRVRHLTIVLDADYRDDDVASIVEALRMIRGVSSIEKHLVEAEDQIARAVVRAEIAGALHRAIESVDEDVFDRFFAARAAVFAHVGCVDDLDALNDRPIYDRRDQFWAINRGFSSAPENVLFSAERVIVEDWIVGRRSDGPYSSVFFGDASSFRLSESVFRGESLTLVVGHVIDAAGNVDGVDDERCPQVFHNNREVRPGNAKALVREHLLNRGVDPRSLAEESGDPQLLKALCSKRKP